MRETSPEYTWCNKKVMNVEQGKPRQTPALPLTVQAWVSFLRLSRYKMGSKVFLIVFRLMHRTQ